MNNFLHVPSLVMAKLREAPDHLVLPGAHRYDVRKLNFLWGHGSDEDRVLDLDLSTHDDYASLRFAGVKDLAIPSGDLISAISIRILDASAFLPEMPAAIRVEHPAGGGLCFWADSVFRLSAAIETT